MSMSSGSVSVGDSDLSAALCQWWQREGLSGPPQVRLVDCWRRSYSKLSVLELEEPAGTSRQTVVCKQVIHQSCNEIYGDAAELVRVEYDALQAAHCAFQSMGRYAVPRPRLILPHLDTLVLDFVAGQPMESSMDALRYTADQCARLQLERRFWQLGRWLHHYQGSTPLQWRDPGALRSVLQHCDHRLQIVQQTGHRWLPADLRSRVLRRLQDWQRALAGPIPVGPCHGDFGPWNALMSDSKLTVLDFCSSRQDCLWVDPLGVLVYLQSQRHAPSFSRRRIRRLQEMFLRGYACTANPPVPLVAICESLQRICRLQDCVQDPAPSTADRYRRWRVLRENLHQLLHGHEPLYTELARGHQSGKLITGNEV